MAQSKSRSIRVKDPLCWRVPLMMLGSLCLGIILAAEHHIFYQSLHGKVVKSHEQQVWNIRIGTGLALLIKVSLTTSVTIACVQCFWWLLLRKTVDISTIDSLFDVLSNGWNLVYYKAWLKGPIIIFLALIAWTIPLSATITPATLTVQLSERLGENQQSMKLPSIDWDKGRLYYLNKKSTDYDMPRPDVERISTAVSASGAIMYRPAPAPNSTYELEFVGPALKCIEANSSVSEALRPMFDKQWQKSYFWAAFVPGNGDNATAWLNNTIEDVEPSCSDNLSTDRARIFATTGDVDSIYAVECGLYNATYRAEFRSDNGDQTITILNLTYGDGVPFNQPIGTHSGNFYPWMPSVWNYQALMESFGRVLVGTGGFGYRARQITHTQVLLTGLVNTREVSDTTGELKFNTNFGDGRNLTLIQGMESLFTNLTLSLFSNADFLKPDNETLPTNVTIFETQNIYIYSRRNLWLAYGLAIAFAALGTLIGLLSLFANNLSFTNSFSTVLRVTRDPKLYQMVKPDETKGQEPLPKTLAKTDLAMRSLRGPDGRMFMSLSSTIKKEEQESQENVMKTAQPRNSSSLTSS